MVATVCYSLNANRELSGTDAASLPELQRSQGGVVVGSPLSQRFHVDSWTSVQKYLEAVQGGKSAGSLSGLKVTESDGTVKEITLVASYVQYVHAIHLC